MEQIVKIFVHQSYFIDNDLVVDYNVEQGAHVNISPKDWIALIPKGWSGVDEQVAFQTVDTNSDIANLAIKSVVMEKQCFRNVIECEKQYQLMYIGQYLEILGRSEYFVFLHQSGTCNCVSSSTKIEGKENSKQGLLSSVFSRKPLRRQSPTPREFYKHFESQKSQNTIVKNEKLKSKQCPPTYKCIKCNAPNNFTALESAYLTKIQDLTINNEVIQQRLLKVEKELVHTLGIINKQFKLSKAISQQKDNIQQFIDDVVDGLLNDGKITFWAHDQEFSVVREFPDKNQTSLQPDDCTTLPINKSINSSKEAYMKAIIGQQEQTIQHLVNKIRDSFDPILKENTQSTEQNNSLGNKISNIGYMDSSGTTYFSPPTYISDTLNDINLYLSNSIKNNNNRIEKFDSNENVYKWKNNTISSDELPDVMESNDIFTLKKGIEDKILTFEDWKKDRKEYTLYTQFSDDCSNKQINGLGNVKNVEKEDDITRISDDSF